LDHVYPAGKQRTDSEGTGREKRVPVLYQIPGQRIWLGRRRVLDKAQMAACLVRFVAGIFPGDHAHLMAVLKQRVDLLHDAMIHRGRDILDDD
jgi:hypothetical protein